MIQVGPPLILRRASPRSSAIHGIRGPACELDADPAILYDVTTIHPDQAVRRDRVAILDTVI